MEEVGKKVYMFGPGNMTTMAAMPIYGKPFKRSSFPDQVDRLPCNLVWYLEL